MLSSPRASVSSPKQRRTSSPSSRISPRQPVRRLVPRDDISSVRSSSSSYQCDGEKCAIVAAPRRRLISSPRISSAVSMRRKMLTTSPTPSDKTKTSVRGYRASSERLSSPPRVLSPRRKPIRGRSRSISKAGRFRKTAIGGSGNKKAYMSSPVYYSPRQITVSPACCERRSPINTGSLIGGGIGAFLGSRWGLGGAALGALGGGVLGDKLTSEKRYAGEACECN
jgi:hypothetical protein